MTTNLHPIFERIFEGQGIDLVPWTDDRLRAAYLILEDVRGEWHPEDGVGEALKRAMDEIETADCEAGELSRPYVKIILKCDDCAGAGHVPADPDDADQDPDICLECNGTGENAKVSA